MTHQNQTQEKNTQGEKYSCFQIEACDEDANDVMEFAWASKSGKMQENTVMEIAENILYHMRSRAAWQISISGWKLDPEVLKEYEERKKLKQQQQAPCA